MKNLYLILLILIGFSCNNKKVKVDLKKSKKQVEIKTEKIKDSNYALIGNVALNFINSYVENCNKMKDQIGIIEWVNKQENVTENLKTELKRIITEAEKIDPELGLGFDPIFDAQDYPDNGFELNKSDNKSGIITVNGKDWKDFKINIKMIMENEHWLVNGIGVINMAENERIER